MSVTGATTRNDYIASAGQTVFAYTFQILAGSDIKVLKNGVTLAFGSSYFVSNVGAEAGGTVTLNAGATASDSISILLAMPITRTTQYQNAGDFLASDVNGDFDKAYIALNQLQTDIGRSISLTDSDPSVDLNLPLVSQRANKFLKFNADGSVGVAVSVDGVVVSSARGIDGAVGPAGPRGETGAAGLRGETGPAGSSALLDSAQTNAINTIPTLTSNVANLASSVDTKATIQSVMDESAARAEAISASATVLQNQVNDLLAIAAYDASVTYVAGDQVTYLGKLYTSSQTTTGNLPTNSSYWNLLGDYSSLGAAVEDNSASIAAINTVTAGSSSAAARSIKSLKNTIEHPTTGFGAVSTTLGAIETQVNHGVTGVNASATKIVALETAITTAAEGAVTTSNAIDALEIQASENTTGLEAAAIKITALESEVSFDGVTANADAINTLDTRTSNHAGMLSAQSTSIGALSSTVNNNSANIAVQSATIDGLKSEFTVKTDVAGKVAGFGLYNDSTTGSEFAIAADKFILTPSADRVGDYSPTPSEAMMAGKIYYSTVQQKYYRSLGVPNGDGRYIWRELTTQSPFVVTSTDTTVGGEAVPAGVYMDNVYIKNGSVDTLSIADQAVTIPSSVKVAINTFYAKSSDTTRTPAILYVANSGAQTNFRGKLLFQPASGNGTTTMNGVSAILDVILEVKYYDGSTLLHTNQTIDSNIIATHATTLSHIIDHLDTPPSGTTRVVCSLKFKVLNTSTSWGINAIDSKIDILEVKK